jgi:hypothetical protein
MAYVFINRYLYAYRPNSDRVSDSWEKGTPYMPQIVPWVKTSP